MKILIVNDYGVEIGGAETYIRLLADHLRKYGDEVRFFSSTFLSEEKKLFSNYNFNNSNVNHISRLLKHLFNIPAYLRFKQVLADYKPDLIHFNNIFYECSPSVVFAGRKLPNVMTLHDYAIICPRSTKVKSNGILCKNKFGLKCLLCIGIIFFYECLKRRFHKRLLSEIKFFIAPSNCMKREIKKEFKNLRIKKFFNGIHLCKFSKIRNFHSILYIGRLTKEKGVNYLVEAMQKVVKKYPESRLVIIGEGPEKKQLERITKDKNVSKNVVFLGYKENKQTRLMYQESSMVIVPSVWPENLPTVIIEAMSAGRPVIGTCIGGIPEMIVDSKTGYLVRPKDSDAIAKKIILLLSNKKFLQKMGMAARKRAELKFDIKNNVLKIKKIYDKAVRENSKK